MYRDIVVPIERLCDGYYGRLLHYPKGEATELGRRLIELKNLGVTAIEFRGHGRIWGIPVLGKGCSSIVLVAQMETSANSLERVAIKIRRMDSNRDDMRHEAAMLKRANAVNVGPKLKDFTDNFLLMELLEGRHVSEWFATLNGNRIERVHHVLHGLLRQCYKLDGIGLDHGELSTASKHILINQNDRSFILDFEAASINRKPRNITAICQYLFIGSKAASKIAQTYVKFNKKQLINALREYKRTNSEEKFQQLLRVAGIGQANPR